MRETESNLRRLQSVLDESHEGAGLHLRSVITPERRLTAVDLTARLTGMKLLALATELSRRAGCRPGRRHLLSGRVLVWHFALRPSHPAHPPKPGRERDAPPGRGIRGHRPRKGAHRGQYRRTCRTGSVKSAAKSTETPGWSGVAKRALLSHRASAHVHVLHGGGGRWVN